METPKESASPSGAPAEDERDGVDVTLPKDMNLVFDWEQPKDKDEAAAMDDAANPGDDGEDDLYVPEHPATQLLLLSTTSTPDPALQARLGSVQGLIHLHHEAT